MSLPESPAQTYRHQQHPASMSVLLRMDDVGKRRECCRILARVGMRLGILYPRSEQDQALEAVAEAARAGAIVLPLPLDKEPEGQISVCAQRMVEDFGRLDAVILALDMGANQSPEELKRFADDVQPYLQKPRPRGVLILVAEDAQQEAADATVHALRKIHRGSAGRLQINLVFWKGAETDFSLEEKHDD